MTLCQFACHRRPLSRHFPQNTFAGRRMTKCMSFPPRLFSVILNLFQDLNPLLTRHPLYQEGMSSALPMTEVCSSLCVSKPPATSGRVLNPPLHASVMLNLFQHLKFTILNYQSSILNQGRHAGRPLLP